MSTWNSSAGYSTENLEGLAEHQVLVRRATADDLRRHRALVPTASTATLAVAVAAPRLQGRKDQEEAGQASAV